MSKTVYALLLAARLVGSKSSHHSGLLRKSFGDHCVAQTGFLLHFRRVRDVTKSRKEGLIHQPNTDYKTVVIGDNATKFTCNKFLLQGADNKLPGVYCWLVRYPSPHDVSKYEEYCCFHTYDGKLTPDKLYASWRMLIESKGSASIFTLTFHRL